MRYVYLVILVFLYVVVAPIAHGHEWFSEKETPLGGSCCGGADCKAIRYGSVRETKEGFFVTLSKSEMAVIRPDLATIYPVMQGNMGGGYGTSQNQAFKALPDAGIVEFIPQSQAQPGQGGYAACLGGSPINLGNGPPRWIICFFYPMNT